MKIKKNVLPFERRVFNGKQSSKKNTSDELANEIIDDSALIDCINQLNQLRDSNGNNENIASLKPKTEREVLEKIDQISAEMKWFSQWLTIKSKSVA